jgi:hypothetical protein
MVDPCKKDVMVFTVPSLPDLAFEDSHFIDEVSGGISWLIIVKILLEVLTSSSPSSSSSSSPSGLPPAVRTFVYRALMRRSHGSMR